MHRGGQRNIWANHDIISDMHRAYIQTGEVEIGPAEPAEGGIAAVIKINRCLQRWHIGGIGQKLTQDGASLLRLIFVCLIIPSRQLSSLDQQRGQLSVAGIVQLPGKHFFFFGHDSLPSCSADRRFSCMASIIICLTFFADCSIVSVLARSI